ncbi:MAG: phospho-N-acetylmuramoyl-pentapeptide-transferase [Anaerolineae bacterium]|nr:phospho-N-acetylmuramoyl-pentapeptide-transferase [Anaerolineae bacterium]
MAYALTLGTVAFLLAVIWGNPLLALLRKYSIGKQIRIDGPSSHQVKMGTPTMGGLMIIVPVVLITVALNIANLFGRTLIGRSILVPIFVMLAFGALGFVDDLAGVRGRKGQGLMARTKFLWQFVIAVPTALVFYFLLDIHSVALPRVPQKIDMGLWYIPVATLLIVGFSNAVNLTDGLDGLAGSTAAVAFVAYGVIANLQGQTWLSAFCFTVTGAIMAFLWFNAYPAQMFMGDVGALALGATLAVVALMTGQWLLLPIIGIVFVAEAMSDILQVAYFKLTGGKRLFKMAPLHHHFELLGWSETHITQRFWLISVLAGMLGVALALW